MCMKQRYEVIAQDDETEIKFFVKAFTLSEVINSDLRASVKRSDGTQRIFTPDKIISIRKV